jgi:K+-transporting ATPase ATPase A chain
MRPCAGWAGCKSWKPAVPLVRPARRQGHGLEGYAIALIVFNTVGAFFVYGLQRLQGFCPESPGTGRQPRFLVQHHHQLRRQHQLAGLRRRTDHELPDADAGLACQNFFSATGIAVSLR